MLKLTDVAFRKDVDQASGKPLAVITAFEVVEADLTEEYANVADDFKTPAAKKQRTDSGAVPTSSVGLHSDCFPEVETAACF